MFPRLGLKPMKSINLEQGIIQDGSSCYIELILVDAVSNLKSFLKSSQTTAPQLNDDLNSKNARNVLASIGWPSSLHRLFLDQHDCIDAQNRKRGIVFFLILCQVYISYVFHTVERTQGIYELFVGTRTRNLHRFSFLFVANYDFFSVKAEIFKRWNKKQPSI